MSDWIEIAAFDGSGRFAAYRATPADRPKAAIIVIQEIFGVNDNIRHKADDWAAAGYLAIAPDMFWRFAPGFVADPDQADEAAKAFEIRARFDLSRSVQDIEATIRVARASVESGKVGVVGYCLGGSVAYLAATRTDADASVGYYGRQIIDHIGEAQAIARPLLLHFGTADPMIPPDMIDGVKAGLRGNRHAEILDYPGAGHGFATTSGTRRNEAQAKAADARTAAFFAEHLA